MITHIYSKRGEYTSTLTQCLLCSVIFLDLTAFFFLSFMNICFDTLVSNPPLWLMITLFLIMGADLATEIYLHFRITARSVFYTVVMILLILSWAIDNQYIVYLSASVLLRFPQVMKFNLIMQAKLRPYHSLFQLYTFLKIFYVIAVVGHVLGCIFYAIDDTLIKQQYYGPIAENPGLYYQGQLLCYSPIYSLDQINRYVYCMYYIMSLLATVAYGDIIPKNPWENAYVCFLLVLSTVSISFIIEQLLIVLSNHREQMYEILKKVKYVDSMLANSTKISTRSRVTLIGYLMHSMKHNIHSNAKLGRLTDQLQRRLVGESIGLKKCTYKIGDRDGTEKIINLGIVQQYSLPSFLVQFLLLKMQVKYFPVRYLIVDNQNKYEPSSMFITIRGEVKLGYGPQMFLKRSIQYRNKLLCWRQFIWDNKQIHPYFRVQTKKLCQLYQLTSEQLRKLLKMPSVSSIHSQRQSEMLEKYHMARNHELTIMYYQSQQIFHNSRSAHLLSLQQSAQQQQIQQISTHVVRCWSCGLRTHMPDKCVNLHYKPNIHELSANNRQGQEHKKWQRRSIQSQKHRNCLHNRTITMNQKVREMLRGYIRRKNDEFAGVKRLVFGSMPVVFEQCALFEHYCQYFNICNLR